MKILKIVLGIIALITIIFFGMGLMNPVIKYSSETEINKPINETWAVAMDESKTSQWIEGLKNYELLSGNRGEVGAVYKISMEQDGQAFEMTEEITAIKPMELMSMNFDSEPMSSKTDIRFTAKDANTTIVSATSEAKGKGIFMQSLFAFMKGSFTKQDEKMYANLKRVVEENTTNYFPPAEAEIVSPADTTKIAQ